MRRPGPLLLLAASFCTAAPAAGQGTTVRFATPAQTPPEISAGVEAEPSAAFSAGPLQALRTPGRAFAASLVIPGAGQAALGLRRWPLYVLAEAGFWWAYVDTRGDVADLTDGYRDLAWETARLGSDLPRRDGGWGYYETMSEYLRSGAFDADPAAGLQPEEDAATYNGYVWSLARAIHLPGGAAEPSSSAYDQALEYYADRAAGPAFLWSWIGYESELSRFRALIRDADAESRRATATLGLILANHLVSAIDALLVSRLRSDAALRLESSMEGTPAGARWRVGLRISPALNP